MAENKKSFLLYCDLITTVKKLPIDKRGELFTVILEYVNDEDPSIEDLLVDVVFEPIKLQLKRDLKKYESIIERNKTNGAKGGRPKKEQPKEPSGLNDNPKKPKQADTVNDTDTVIDNDTVKVKDIKNIVYSDEIHNCLKNCLIYFPDQLHPKKRDKWLDTIDKLNRVDKFSFEDIEKVVKKTREDNFWSKNFRALPKLRRTDKDGIKYIIIFKEIIDSNGHNKKVTTGNKRPTDDQRKDFY